LETVITQLVSHEPKTVKGRNGDFTVHKFKDANGAEFQTTDQETANSAFALTGDSKGLSRIAYAVEERKTQRGTFKNNDIKFIEPAPAGSTQEDTSSLKYGGGGGGRGGWGGKDPAVQRQINRSAALSRAIEAHAAGLASLQTSEALFALADKFVVYIETDKTAPEGQGGAVSSDGGGADGAAATAAAPTAEAPTGPSESIPF